MANPDPRNYTVPVKNILDSYAMFREEVKELRDRWLAGELTEEQFEVYRAKVFILGTMQMYSWNVLDREYWIHDDERFVWLNELPY